MDRETLNTIHSKLIASFDVSLFLNLTDFLTEITTKEINLLRNVEITDIEELQPLKKEAYEIYANVIDVIRKEPEIIADLSPNEKDVLRRVTKNLSQLLEKNERTLYAFNLANKKVMDIFYNISKNEQVVKYGPNRKKGPNTPKPKFGQSG